MKDCFYDVKSVISFSRKLQWILVIAMAGPLMIFIYQDYMLRDFHLAGPLAPMTDVLKEKLKGRCDKAALICFVSFVSLAIKQYREDKKRLDGLW